MSLDSIETWFLQGPVSKCVVTCLSGVYSGLILGNTIKPSYLYIMGTQGARWRPPGVNTHIHTDIQTYAHTCIHTYIHAYVHIQTTTHEHIHTCTSTYIDTHPPMNTYTHAHTDIHRYTHTYMNNAGKKYIYYDHIHTCMYACKPRVMLMTRICFASWL